MGAFGDEESPIMVMPDNYFKGHAEDLTKGLPLNA
jgi:hypothetical protein